MKLRHFWILTFCCLICGARLSCPHVVPSFWGTYEALAHVFCGLLIGLWLISRDRFCLLALIAITVFETIAFFVTK